MNLLPKLPPLRGNILRKIQISLAQILSLTPFHHTSQNINPMILTIQPMRDRINLPSSSRSYTTGMRYHRVVSSVLEFNAAADPARAAGGRVAFAVFVGGGAEGFRFAGEGFALFGAVVIGRDGGGFGGLTGSGDYRWMGKGWMAKQKVSIRNML